MAETTNTNNGLSFTSGNEINLKGIVIAGALFILFMILSIIGLIAYWPDKLPHGEELAIYNNRLFNVRLLDSNNQCESCPHQRNLIFSKVDSDRIDSIVRRRAESKNPTDQNLSDSLKKTKFASDSTNISDFLYKLKKLPSTLQGCNSTIGLNTLLLLLVSIAGFLGTMIHTASSFTNFVGAEKFRRSWVLWYVVKPFTGAALALLLYFVFRAGLLNFNDTSNINLYGVITLAAFAGLFTDKATMKLAEVFDVIFRTVDPKTGKIDSRPDSLNSDQVNLKITGIKPETLIATSDNNLTISGTGLDKQKLIIKIDNDEITNPVIKSGSISLTYKIPEGSDKKEFILRILDEKGNEIYTSKLTKSETDNNIDTGARPRNTTVDDVSNPADSQPDSNTSNPNPDEVDDENNSSENING